jgi:hypothetical protein
MVEVVRARIARAFHACVSSTILVCVIILPKTDLCTCGKFYARSCSCQRVQPICSDVDGAGTPHTCTAGLSYWASRNDYSNPSATRCCSVVSHATLVMLMQTDRCALVCAYGKFTLVRVCVYSQSAMMSMVRALGTHVQESSTTSQALRMPLTRVIPPAAGRSSARIMTAWVRTRPSLGFGLPETSLYEFSIQNISWTCTRNSGPQECYLP